MPWGALRWWAQAELGKGCEPALMGEVLQGREGSPGLGSVKRRHFIT